MKITLLGTGTPTPSLRRMGASHLVEIADDVILLDHGPGAHHRLLEAGRRAVDVSHLFFSHLHYDHCVDYARLVLTRWDQAGGIIPDLAVYGPTGTRAMSERLFDSDGAYNLDIRARTELDASLGYYQARGGTLPRPRPSPVITELDATDTIETDHWRLTIASVPHAQPVLTCFAYRFDTDAGSLVYSGDAAPSQTLTDLATECDVLIQMCHRISGTQLTDHGGVFSSGHLEVARTAHDAGVKTVVLTHISEQMDSVGMHEKLLREMGEVYGGNIIWGEDLMAVPVGGPVAGALI